ncbi:serine/threonine-protein kinase Nek3-like [Apostichopus japonicus]|uniref:serine/threonine-protein kinase Nek3-like n=1 Tax=Stichopus japonicus TaxID=307972 RepID=UPI003AB836DF
MTAPVPARCINGYQIMESIGIGTFGETYRVVKNSQVFAMKEPNISQFFSNVDDATEKTTSENQQNEAEIMSSLKHANVVSYVESFSDVSLTKLYIVMEYCEHGNLRNVLNSGDPRVGMEYFVEGVMKQLCCGLAYIHSMNVIHRDIKPENIFIKGDGVIKIGDFGLSKVLQPGEYTNTICGTPGYISPECLKGHPYTYPSDMFSVGKVLFDLLLNKMMHPTVSALPIEYWIHLKALCGNLLSEEPRCRPTAAQALVILGTILKGASAGNCIPETYQYLIHGRSLLCNGIRLRTPFLGDRHFSRHLIQGPIQ